MTEKEPIKRIFPDSSAHIYNRVSGFEEVTFTYIFETKEKVFVNNISVGDKYHCYFETEGGFPVIATVVRVEVRKQEDSKYLRMVTIRRLPKTY